MDELAGPGAMGKLNGGKFDVVELPVTIACTGNRRGEVNSIKQTSGFSWGPSAVSTCVWRGVLVADILRECGVHLDLNHSGRYVAFPRRNARHDGHFRRLYLHYEGADALTGAGTGPKVPFATSIPLLHALDPHNDVLLAFGRTLRLASPLVPRMRS